MNISSFTVYENVCLSVNLHVSFHPLELLKRSAAGASALDYTATAMHYLDAVHPQLPDVRSYEMSATTFTENGVRSRDFLTGRALSYT